MLIQRLVWIIVAILLLAVAFTGGFAVATLSARRMNVSGFNIRAATLRGNAPNNLRAQPHRWQGVTPNVPNKRMTPNNRKNSNQGGRGNSQVSPNRPRFSLPPRQDVPRTLPPKQNRLPRQAQ